MTHEREIVITAEEKAEALKRIAAQLAEWKKRNQTAEVKP
jgi:hypothetical protein